MAKAINSFFWIALAIYSSTAQAGVFDQKETQTPKWARVYARLGRATGHYGESPKSFNVNTVGYKNMRGQFGYGSEYTYLYSSQNQLELTSVSMSIRPDWNLEAEPSVTVSYGLASLLGEDASKQGRGSFVAVGIGLDLFKGPFYSTSVGIHGTHLNSDAVGIGTATFQSATFSVNVDLY